MMRVLWAAFASAGLLVLAGCALAANPQPPTLWLPEPVRDLSAVRVGNEVHLHWTMPKNTTDKVALKGDQKAHICWTAGAAPVPGKSPASPMPSSGLPGCTTVGDAVFPPQMSADFTAKLPADLTTGAPRVVSFFVELQNEPGKTAGPSNPAWIATGTAPAAAMDLSVTTQAGGPVLHWQKAAPEADTVLRIHRTLITPPGAAKPSESAGTPPPQEQTLEVDLSTSDPGQAIDRDAALDHVYRYKVERVLRVTLDSHALEVAGPSSEPFTVDAKDTFPPAVPSGLAIVADEQGHALDLSWNPDTDADLAGYVVYRRDVTAGAADAERISGKDLVVPPSFEDKAVAAGHRYAYSVSAVDRDGNESARCGEVEEGLPQ
jgi:hypothetical protein